MMTPVQAAEFLKSRDDILILTHRRPDGDTIGCAAGLCAALRRIGKRAAILYNEEITPNNAHYAEPYWTENGSDFTTVVSVDVAAYDLFPQNAKPYIEKIALAIDHHPSFEKFGENHCVYPERAACGEIVYEIVCAMDALAPESALPLYAAVSTDTGCFVYTNTTPNTHRVAAALMEQGIDYKTVNKRHFRTKTKKRLALEGAMLSAMEFFDEDRVVVLQVPRSLMESVQATEADAEDLSALGGLVEGTDCSVTMRELGANEWKISVRSGKRINATEVCAKHGGGGHAAAAGCTVRGTADEVKAKIVATIDEVAHG